MTTIQSIWGEDEATEFIRQTLGVTLDVAEVIAVVQACRWDDPLCEVSGPNLPNSAANNEGAKTVKRMWLDGITKPLEEYMDRTLRLVVIPEYDLPINPLVVADRIQAKMRVPRWEEIPRWVVETESGPQTLRFNGRDLYYVRDRARVTSCWFTAFEVSRILRPALALIPDWNLKGALIADYERLQEQTCEYLALVHRQFLNEREGLTSQTLAGFAPVMAHGQFEATDRRYRVEAKRIREEEWDLFSDIDFRVLSDEQYQSHMEGISILRAEEHRVEDIDVQDAATILMFSNSLPGRVEQLARDIAVEMSGWPSPGPEAGSSTETPVQSDS